MATAKPQVDLECPVCHEDFAKPKFLPCAHVICNKCVLSWLSAKGDGGCPLCRAAILPTIHPEPSDIATLVDDLPTDLATKALVESQKALSSRHVCNVCDDDTVATSYCLDCGIMFCKFCLKAHGRMPVSRDHVLEDLSTLTAERLAASRRSPCDSHPDRPAELYCGHHQTLICILCATSKHRACPGVASVGDMAGQARAALTEQVNRLKEKESKLCLQIKQLEQEMKDTQAHFSDSRSEVKTIYDRVQQTIEKRRQEINVQLEQEEKKVMAPKQAEKTQLERNMVSISAHVGSVERLVAIFADSAVVGMLDKLKTRLDELETQIQPTEGAKRGSLHSFVISNEDLMHLEREITSIGQITSASEISSSGLPVPSAQNDTDAFRLILLGGVGKSSTGNTILGEKRFQVGHGLQSVTCRCQTASVCRNGRTIEILDTPAILHNQHRWEDVGHMIMQDVGRMNPGPHAFLFVVRGDVRFTEEEFMSFQFLKSWLGADITRHMIIVVTRGDCYRNENMKFEDVLHDLPEDLQTVLSECDHRWILFNNKAEDKQPQVDRLLHMVTDLVDQNGGKCYTLPLRRS